MQLLCRHILAAGRQCAAVALRGKLFCYHHDKLHIERRSSGLRNRIRTQTYDLATIPVPDGPVHEPVSSVPLALEFPEDPASILTNIYRVTNLLLAGHIDRPTANSVTYGMQVCLSALHGKPLIEPASTPQSRSNSDDDSDSEHSNQPIPPPLRTVTRVILTPDGDEIAPPVEILEDNEAEPIHHRLCPCLACAEKYRNQPPEQHHPDCQCGLCEEDESSVISEQGSELLNQSSPTTNDDVILSEVWREAPNEVEGPAVTEPATTPGALRPDSGTWDSESATTEGASRVGSDKNSECHPERSAPRRTESRDLLFPKPATTDGAPLKPGVGLSGTDLHPTPYPLHPKPRVARAVSLLSGSANRDPLNRPWSVAEYTFGDAIRRHEAQYAARAAAALAVGIEPPPYEPYETGLFHPGTPEYEEDQKMQQHSSEYWAAHFQKLIAQRGPHGQVSVRGVQERPDIQQYLDQEKTTEAAETGNSTSQQSQELS